MKRLLYSAALACFTSITWGQTLTFDDLPAAGDSAQFATAIPDSNVVLAGGVSQTWDFSGVTTGVPFSVKMQDPSKSGYGNTYSNSNINEYWLSTNQRFFEHTSDTIFFDGAVVNANPTFSDGAVWLTLPLEMGITSTYPMLFAGVQLNTSSHTFSLDGFGTLITPDATFNNVYKVLMRDTIDYGFLLAPSIEVLWYQQGGGMFLARATATYSFGVWYWGIDLTKETPVTTGVTQHGSFDNDKELVKIVDLMGRETTEKSNSALIYIYSDGSTERVITVK